MSKGKDKWKSVSLPRNFLRRIRSILGFVADESIAERSLDSQGEVTHLPRASLRRRESVS